MSVASTILIGDCRDVLPTLPAGGFQTCVTSPPYFGLRDYGNERQIGREPTPKEYVNALVGVFREVRRVLADDGTLWLNLGDSYAGSWGAQSRPNTTDVNEMRSTLEGSSTLSARQMVAASRATNTGSLKRTPGLKPKDLCGIPWRVAIALQDDGWFLRSDIIWSKPNPMPESVADRPTKAHEYVFMLSKREHYFYDADAIREPRVDIRANKTGANARRGQALMKPTGKSDTPDRWYNREGRNARSVWTIATESSGVDHYATFPRALPRRCILAGSRSGDSVLDPFGGAGTTGSVAVELGRNATLIELNPTYGAMAEERTAQRGLGL